MDIADRSLAPDSPAALHAATLTLDTHVDIPWPDTPDPRGETRRKVDFPKMRAGGLKAVVFIAFVPQTRRDAANLAAAAERAEAMLRAIRATADGTAVRIATTASEVEAVTGDGALALMLGVENGHALGGDVSRLRRFRDLGACYMTLTHDGHNDLGDSARPRADLGDPAEEHGGLTALGRAAIAEMNRVGLLVDVSHVSKRGMLEAARISRVPVVATHTACRAIVDHPRNLDDGQLDALRATGGLAQVTAVASFLKAAPRGGVSDATITDLVDHVDHAVARIGIDHVGISSDFDGGGAVRGWNDAAETANVTAELRRRGYTAREIGLLWSGNFLRLMRLAERAAAG
jgi:membrane dipeptidase